jgi:glycine cleavage system T protein
MRIGEARYSLLLNEQGGVIDDLFIYRLGESGGRVDSWFVVVNAGNKKTDFDWFTEHLPSRVFLKDLSDETYMIAVQGPRASELLDLLVTKDNESEQPGIISTILDSVPLSHNVSSIPRSQLARVCLGGIPVLAGRTGYTGEDGAEIYFAAENAQTLWEAILAEAESAGIEAGPVGLAARDSLRFEAGMPLHGHEIGPEINPMEALLSWACDFTKDFTGKEALLAQKAAGLKRKLATVNVTGGVPREAYKVMNDKEEPVGEVVAGMFCPSTGTYSANIFMPPEYAVAGTKLMIEIRGTLKEAEVTKRPLYMPVYRK